MMDKDLRAKIQLYNDYNRTGMPIYKQCCIHDIIYNHSCHFIADICPLSFISNLNMLCELHTRLSVLK